MREEVKINSGVRGQRANSRIKFFYDEFIFKRKNSLG